MSSDHSSILACMLTVGDPTKTSCSYGDCSWKTMSKSVTPVAAGTIHSGTYSASAGTTTTSTFTADLCVLSGVNFWDNGGSLDESCLLTGTPGSTWTLEFKVISGRGHPGWCKATCYNL
ncbi:MAG: hypothetical protein PHD48_02195 [Alphaproteobacteria bacterium]|nr:hypothetical protein [Alphaproteobacteria bacterium]